MRDKKQENEFHITVSRRVCLIQCESLCWVMVTL